MLTFIDLETTGLDELKDSILEVAVVVATDDLETVTAFCSVVVEPLFGTLSQMDPVVVEMHTKNGLLAECMGPDAMRRHEAEAEVLGFLSSIEGTKGCPVAGNSVWFDKNFIRRHMPKLHGLFHYRIVDVSSFNEMAQRWNPELFEGRPRSDENHRALTDAETSLQTMRYYKKNGLFRPACREAHYLDVAAGK